MNSSILFFGKRLKMIGCSPGPLINFTQSMALTFRLNLIHRVEASVLVFHAAFTACTTCAAQEVHKLHLLR